MAYKRRAKEKEDLRENPTQGVDTSMGRYYLRMGLVKIIDKQNKTIRTKTL